MRSVLLAWIVGEGLMIANDVTRQHRPPLPAELLQTSGLFVLLALLGERAPSLAATLAWGFDAAAFMVLMTNRQAAAAKPAAPRPAPKGN